MKSMIRWAIIKFEFINKNYRSKYVVCEVGTFKEKVCRWAFGVPPSVQPDRTVKILRMLNEGE